MKTVIFIAICLLAVNLGQTYVILEDDPDGGKPINDGNLLPGDNSTGDQHPRNDDGDELPQDNNGDLLPGEDNDDQLPGDDNGDQLPGDDSNRDLLPGGDLPHIGCFVARESCMKNPIQRNVKICFRGKKDNLCRFIFEKCKDPNLSHQMLVLGSC